MRKKGANQSGFSLIQVLMVAGIMGFLSLMMMKMMTNQQKQQRSLEANLEVSNFLQTIRSELSRSRVCLENFKGVKVSGSNAIKIQHLKDATGKIRFQLDTLYGHNRFRIKKMSLGPYEPEPNYPANGYLPLHLELEKNGQIYGNRTLKRKVDLLVSLDQSNSIQSCSNLAGNSSLEGISFKEIKEALRESQESSKDKESQGSEISQMSPKEINEAITKGTGPNVKEINQLIEKDSMLKALRDSALDLQKAQKQIQKMLDQDWEGEKGKGPSP